MALVPLFVRTGVVMGRQNYGWIASVSDLCGRCWRRCWRRCVGFIDSPPYRTQCVARMQRSLCWWRGTATAACQTLNPNTQRHKYISLKQVSNDIWHYVGFITFFRCVVTIYDMQYSVTLQRLLYYSLLRWYEMCQKFYTPIVFWKYFQNGWEFLTAILHAYCRPTFTFTQNY